MPGVQFAPERVYQDPFLDEGIKGEWFGSGKGPVDVAGSSNLRFLVVNPVGSGKIIMIHRYRIHVTTASEYVSILVNPTTNLPVGAVPSTNRKIGNAAGVAVITCDAGASMGGGTTLPYQIPVQVAGSTFTEFHIYPSILVPPGFSIGTNFSNTTGGTSKVTTLLDWREIPI